MATPDITLKTDLDITDVKKTARELRVEFANIAKSAQNKQMPATFRQLELSMQKVATKSRELSRELEANMGTRVKTDYYKQLEADTDKAKAKVEELAKQLENLKKAGVGEDTTRYKELQIKYDEALARRQELIAAKRKANITFSGDKAAKMAYEDTADYKAKVEQLNAMNEKLYVGNLRLQERIQKQTQLEAKQKEQRLDTDDVIGKEGEEAEKTEGQLNKLENQKKRTSKANAELSNSAAKTTAKFIAKNVVLKSLITELKALHRLAKAVGNGLKIMGRGLGSIVSKMRGANKNTEDTTKSIRTLLKFALKYGLGMRSIFLLYKKIRQAGIEAYKGLITQFPELQAEINELKNSFFQLKNSLATAAQPIVSALIPAIKTLASWLTAALTALANFFAILTGAKYIYKAAKVNKDWAKSASGAGKAAKEASEDIAEYDNLILIQQDNDGGGGGGAGDIDEYAGAWEKVEAESDFAQKLKDAINAGDWEGVGATIAQKLNSVVLRLDNWVNYKFRPFGKKWANQIARILNGLTEAFDSGKLGKTVADSLNALADIVNEFFTTYNFLTLGSKVGTAITSFFKNLDAQLISTAMANRLNAMITFVKGLLADLDFEGIGNKIGTGIKNFVETVNWRQLGENMYNLGKGLVNAIITAFKDGNLINTFANAVKEFLTGARIKEVLSNMADLAKTVVDGLANAMTNHQIGKRAGEALNNLFKNIKVKEVMTSLVNLANSIITELSNFLLTVDWHEIANAIVDLFNKINFEDVLSTLMTVAINIVDALATAILKIDWGKIGDAIANLIASIDWMQLLGTLVKAALGLVKALGQALLSLVTNPEALLSIAEGLALIFGAKFIWGKVSGAIGGGLASALSTGFASAGGSAGLATALKNSLSGALGTGLKIFGAAELGGRAGAWLGKVIFAGSDEKLQEAYEEFGKAPIINTFKAIWTELGALFEKSTLTGNTTLGTALTDWFSGGAYLDDKLNAWLEENNKIVDANYQKYLDMLERRVKEGKVIRDSDMELLKKYRDFDAQVNESLVTNSNHYADIAKQNAGVVTQAEKAMADEAIANSNHYVEIAKANAQEHKNVFAEMLSSVNSVMDEANKHMDDVKKSAIESSNHYAEIAKQQSGYYKKIADEAVKSSNHYVEIAKQNMKTEQDEADATATHVKEAVADIPEVYESTFSSAVAKMESAFDGTQTYFDGVAEGVKQPFSTMAEYFGDTFGDAWGRAVDVFETDTPAFQKIESSIGGVFKNSINSMIDGVNTTMTGPFSKLSAVLNQMRGFTVGGARIFASLPSFSVPKIPRLAQGAVLPPNQPFIAQVGEQTHGTNVEAPLETIAEALRQVLSENSGSNNQPIVLQLNGNQIARAVWDEENKRYKQTGSRFSYS